MLSVSAECAQPAYRTMASHIATDEPRRACDTHEPLAAKASAAWALEPGSVSDRSSRTTTDWERDRRRSASWRRWRT